MASCLYDCEIILVRWPFLFICCQNQYDCGMVFVHWSFLFANKNNMSLELFWTTGHSYLPTKAERLWNYYSILAIPICQQKQKDCGIILVYWPFLFANRSRKIVELFWYIGHSYLLSEVVSCGIIWYISHSYLFSEAIRLRNLFVTLAVFIYLIRSNMIVE